MNIISELETLYFEVDNDYSSKEFEARGKRYFKIENSFKRKRELNTHAFFLFTFSRLEDHIRERSKNLISTKQDKLKDWKNRAVWDILPTKKNSNDIHFMNRVALLTDKSEPAFSLIQQYYKQRNSIGHGGNFTIPVNMTDVFKEMKLLLKIK